MNSSWAVHHFLGGVADNPPPSKGMGLGVRNGTCLRVAVRACGDVVMV